jgi:hypothetical protein
MAFASLQQLREARAICEQEIGLIDAAIARERIPFPSRITRERPQLRPVVRALAQLRRFDLGAGIFLGASD